MATATVLGAAPTGEKRTSYQELFFDLVFVFAITQIAAALHHDHSGEGWVHAGLVMWLVWWAWSQFTWTGNAVDLGTRPMRIVLLAMSGATLFAAAMIPHAFAADGLWFAAPYGAVRIVALGVYWVGLLGDDAHRAALRTYLPVAAFSPVAVLVGGALDAGIRPWFWLAAVVVDVASVLAAGRGEFQVSPAHFAERHALIVIVALGESVVAVGATAAGAPRTAGMVGVVSAAAVIVCALWWAYFDWVQHAAEARLAAEPDHRRRANLARDLYTLGHLPIVAGTVVFAVGVEEALSHPHDSLGTFGRIAVGGGVVAFQLGFLLGNYRATRTWFVERAVAAAASAALVGLLGPSVSALGVLVLLAAVLVATAAAETVRRSPSSR